MFPNSHDYDREKLQRNRLEENDKFFEKMNILRTSQKYIDVEIQVEDKTFFCHKNVLAVSSEYFDGLIGGGFKESKQDRICLDVVSANTFETILTFIYCRQIEVQNENATDLLIASDFLGIHYIKELCLEYIKKNYRTLPIENTLELWQFALNTSERENGFFHRLCHYLAGNFSLLLQVSSFAEISYLALSSLLQVVDFHIYGNEIAEAIIRWVNYQLDDRKVLLPELIEMIKFGGNDTPWLNALLNFAADCNKTEVVSPSTLIPSNVISKSISSLHLYCSCYGSDSYQAYGRYCVLALDHKLEWKCYSRKNRITYDDSSKIHYIGSPHIDYASRTVCDETLYQIFQHNDRSMTEEPTYFFRSDLSNMNNLIRLQEPPLIPGKLCTVQDKVYFYHGGDDALCLIDRSFLQHGLQSMCDIVVYESQLDEWFSVPRPPVSGSIPVSCNNCLYLLASYCGRDSTDLACRYDSRMSKWELLPPMQYTHHKSAGCECNGKIYVCSRESYQTEYFDPVANKWARITPEKTMTSSIVKRGYCALAPHKDLVWAVDENIDKYGNKTDKDSSYTIAVDVYDPKTNIWSGGNSPGVAMRGLGDKSGNYKVSDFINITMR